MLVHPAEFHIRLSLCMCVCECSMKDDLCCLQCVVFMANKLLNYFDLCCYSLCGLWNREEKGWVVDRSGGCWCSLSLYVVPKDVCKYFDKIEFVLNFAIFTTSTKHVLNTNYFSVTALEN